MIKKFITLIIIIYHIFSFSHAQLLSSQNPKPNVFQTGINATTLKTAQQAFMPVATVIDPQTLKIEWQIDPDYYLYKNKIKISLETKLNQSDKQSNTLSIGHIELPKGKEYDDEFFGKQEIYDTHFSMTAQLIGEWDQKDAILQIQAQGCAKEGLCFAPEEWRIPIVNTFFKQNTLRIHSLPDENVEKSIVVDRLDNPFHAVSVANTSDNLSQTIATNTTPNQANDAPQSEYSRLVTILNQRHYVALPLFFLLGLLLSFTPCVLPMLPIISSIILGDNSITPRKGFLFAGIYVLSASLTYSIMGMIAGYLGTNITAFFQQPIVIVPFVLLFIFLSIAMFGVIHIQLPPFLQTKLHRLSHSSSTESSIGKIAELIIMGFLSALIVGPCVAPPLIAVLTMISETGNIILGGVTLFVMGLGMGIPILILGISCGHLLPKAGAWMDNIKHFFGYLLLLMALYFASRIMQEVYYQAGLGIWGAFFIAWLFNIPTHRKFSQITKHALIFILAVASFYQLWNVLDLLHNKSENQNNQFIGLSTESKPNEFIHIKGIKGLDTALKNNEGQLVMLEFSADWCVECKRMDKYTFSDPTVKASFKNIVLLRADVTINDEIDQALIKKFKLFGPPAMLFFDQNGQELSDYRVMGYVNATEFNQLLQQILSK